MLPIAEFIMLADGWRRRLVALATGACGALALAPLDILPAAFIPIMAAVWLIDGATTVDEGGTRFTRASLRRAFWAGWWWGFGFFVAGLWWMGAAFLVDADEFAWALPLGVVVVPAGLALFPAAAFALARALWSPGMLRIFALAGMLGVTEWLRGTVLTGFPWNAWGMVLGSNVVTAQLAAFVGLNGLTPITVAIFALPAVLLPEGGDRRRAWLTPSLAATALALIACVGLVRLRSDNGATVANVKFRLVQPDVAQDEKFRPENRAAIVSHYIDLSTRSAGPGDNGLAGVTALVWPESAFPFILARDPEALSRIAAALPAKTVLITGAARQQAAADTSRRSTYFNAVQVIDHDGTIVDSYDKVHLVPFGEYLPFQGLLDRLGMRQFVHVPGGFEPGRIRRLLHAPGLPPIAPLICYEAIFPGEVVPLGAPGDARPGLLLNVTNDSWFGLTAGPYQHLAQARLRAIEEGLPLVRDANTGISAFVDPYGRIVSQLALGAQGFLDGPLFAAIEPPLASRHPLLPAVSMWLLCAALSLAGRRRV